MHNIEALSRPLIEAATGTVNVSRAYDDYLRMLLASPLWSLDKSEAPRIPWRSAKGAATHPATRIIFRSPGLYLFGSAVGVPLYLGMSSKPLWVRLGKRYLSGRRSQCQLAFDYERELVAHGLGGFPDEVRVWYARSYRSSTTRLRGAVSFARHGIEGIWFTLLPIEQSTAVQEVEERLIPVAAAWNHSHGYPPLLNVHGIDCSR